MNIFNLIKKETEEFANKTAVVEEEQGISYSKLISLVEETACVLKEKGIEPFHRVGLLCDSSIDYICASLAILSISAVVVPVSRELTEKEVRSVINDIKLDFLVFKKVLHSDEKVEILSLAGIIKDDLCIKKMQHNADIPDEYYKINPAFIRFSSGTTGKSKGVVLSHEAIVERTDAANEGLAVTSEDLVLWLLSMSFHFVVSILLFLRRAATIIICHNDFSDSLAESIIQHKPSFIYASPYHYDILRYSDLLNRESFRAVRLAISTTMKLPQQTATVFFEKFNCRLAEAYGIIEVGLPFINLSNNHNKSNSVGKILPSYEVKIVEQDSVGVGKIYLRGKGMADAYFFPWRKKKDILEDGWFKTGDIGCIDDEGFLTILGREKHVINFTGIKIFPLEIEMVLNQYPLIYESLVYGEPHEKYGQLPVAKIVLKGGCDCNLDLSDLRRFCYKRLASYKVPKAFSCVERLPKTASGKLRSQDQHR